MVKTIQQGLAGVKEARLFGCERFFLDAFRRSGEAYSRSLVVHGVTGILPRYVLEIVGVLALVLVTIAMLGRGAEARAVLPLLGALAVAAVRLLPSLARILGSVAQIRFHKPSLDALYDAFQLEGPDAAQRELRKDRVPPLRMEREVRMVDVHYTYPGAAEPSLRGVTLRLAKGESVGLVGLSGGGKTTIADTLIGLLTPDRGRVEVDGEPLEGERLIAWQRNIGYIPQTIFLCDDTIRRNVAFGVEDEEIDDERVREALKAARLDELVATLPEGLSTFVGERGIRLSGGQRQRIGIARALYFDPKVLVLDEATSSLDGATEREVVEAIERLRSERTMLVIAHRLSTVRACDRIVLVAKGEILDSGTWDDLLGRSDEFRKLVRLGQTPEREHGANQHPPAH
jgi:ATP-binding cassette subfamily C protein